MIVIRWHFRRPKAPYELNYEFTSQTCFAAHASSRLFSGRNVDRTRESGGNRAYISDQIGIQLITQRLSFMVIILRTVAFQILELRDLLPNTQQKMIYYLSTKPSLPRAERFTRSKVNFELNFGRHFVLSFSSGHVIKVSKIFGDLYHVIQPSPDEPPF